MFGFTLKNSFVTTCKPKVIFDTNAYRNFVVKFLSSSRDDSIVRHLKECESRLCIEPSSNLLTIMELYQHLRDEDKASATCKKAILFSFERSYINGYFSHQPLPEVEISSRLFNQVSDVDNNINAHFLEEHVKFCFKNRTSIPISSDDFIKLVCEQIQSYKETSFISIINNLQRLFTGFDTDSFKFAEDNYKVFQQNYGKDRINLYVQFGYSLYNAFKNRLNINIQISNMEEVITQIICDYRPAFHAYVTMLEKFSNNKPTSKSPFVPDKNDLIDAFILFSVVPDDNIILVTDEKIIHQVFKEIGQAEFVYKLDDYLEKIGFNGNLS